LKKLVAAPEFIIFSKNWRFNIKSQTKRTTLSLPSCLSSWVKFQDGRHLSFTWQEHHGMSLTCYFQLSNFLPGCPIECFNRALSTNTSKHCQLTLKIYEKFRKGKSLFCKPFCSFKLLALHVGSPTILAFYTICEVESVMFNVRTKRPKSLFCLFHQNRLSITFVFMRLNPSVNWTISLHTVTFTVYRYNNN
jgi:hypothetical protein